MDPNVPNDPNDPMPAALLARYPALRDIPPLQLRSLTDALHWLRLPAGTVVFDERQSCSGFPFILQGSIRVAKLSPTGRELGLYRVAPGDSCIITCSCLLGSRSYDARGTAEVQTELGLLPPADFERAIALPAFRRFVFDVFSTRIAALIQVVEEVAFRRLDQRLAAYLWPRAPVLRATHQQLADELGSVREIVSRLLKQFADRRLIALGREQIDVLDVAGLRDVADGG